MKVCNICSVENPIDAKFCIGCRTQFANTQPTIKLEVQPYFIFRSEIEAILKDVTTHVFNGSIYYQGRRVAFLD